LPQDRGLGSVSDIVVAVSHASASVAAGVVVEEDAAGGNKVGKVDGSGGGGWTEVSKSKGKRKEKGARDD